MIGRAAVLVHDLELDPRKTPEEITVLCTGKINSGTSLLLLNTVQPLIGDSKRIVLDLANVKHLDSSGVGALFKLWVNAKKAECEFKFTNPNERITGLLTTTNLSKILAG
jgi:anti-anti-sigma factor